MTIRVDRCICTDQTFVALRQRAQREGLSLDEIMALTGLAGQRCGMCRPYLRQALQTGQTVFHELLPDDPAT